MIPNKIFIVPYRDREYFKLKFIEKMKMIMKDYKDYEIYFSHQCDNRPFNRGAVKNLGFIAMKKKYPNHYKNITFIFNDVDTFPINKYVIKDYDTKLGVVKHFYGFTHTLGGIFSIKGSDFEKTEGFCNFWGWGFEDNIMNDRCLSVGLKIDRSNFYNIFDKNIIHMTDTNERIISLRDSVVYKYETPDNMFSLRDININIENDYINIMHFKCNMNEKDQEYKKYKIPIGNNKFNIPNGYYRKSWNMNSIFKKR